MSATNGAGTRVVGVCGAGGVVGSHRGEERDTGGEVVGPWCVELVWGGACIDSVSGLRSWEEAATQGAKWVACAAPGAWCDVYSV